MKIYTKSGDKGQTSLVSGTRVSKSEERIELYGRVDELNCYLGHLIVSLELKEGIDNQREILYKVQHNLFNLGSLLACESEKRVKYKLPIIDKELTSSLEKSIDFMNTELPELKKFILPGGCEQSSRCHLVRANTRGVERLLVRFFEIDIKESIENAVIFLNRLSDFMFVFSRYLNFKNKKEEIFWES